MVDFSGLSDCAPRAWAAGLSTGRMRVSTGLPLTSTLVVVVQEVPIWPRVGAR
ncbi:hypothetical protein D3C76_1853540 [compost metagenome]